MRPETITAGSAAAPEPHHRRAVALETEAEMRLIKKLKEWLAQLGAEAGIAEPRQDDHKHERKRDDEVRDAMKWD